MPNVWNDHLDEIERQRAESDKRIGGLWNGLREKLERLKHSNDAAQQSADALERAEEKAREGRRK